MAKHKDNGSTLLEIVDSTTSTNNIYLCNASFDRFNRICRFCLGYENIKSMFNMSYKEISIENIVFDCASLKVDAGDQLPKHICTSCLAELISCYNFREKCIQAENILIGICNKNIPVGNEGLYGGQDKSELSNSIKNELSIDEDTNFENESTSRNVCNKESSIENGESNISEINSVYEDDKFSPISKDINSNDNNVDEDDKNKEDFKAENVILDCSEHFSDSSLDLDTKTKVRVRRNKANRLQGFPFNCKDCMESFHTKNQLREHQKTVKHPKAKNHVCTICNKRFTRSQLKQHMRVHTKEKPFVCKICSQSFSMTGNLKRHMMTHTGERPHVCEMCGKGFIQATTLHIHKRTHLSAKYDSLESNCSREHVTCEICGRGFKRMASYKSHLAKHYPDNVTDPQEIKPRPKDVDVAREYTCDICHGAYTTKYLLKIHQLTHGEKSYLCSDCGKGFITKAGLQSHLKIHTGEKPHTCTVCKKSFAHLVSFNSHVLIHTGKKPYNCKVCNKSFTQSAHLMYHARTHSGERPYACNFCGKTFALKGNLTVHIRTHTGETPYLCPICGKGFYDSSSMKKHRKKGHINVAEEMRRVEQQELKLQLTSC